MFEKVFALICLVTLLVTTVTYADYKYGNEIRQHYPNYPHVTLPVAKGVEPINLSFNGRGLPVLFVKETNGSDTVYYGIQYEDSDNDGTFTPTHIYDVICSR
jgi:hypothetical protein